MLNKTIMVNIIAKKKKVSIATMKMNHKRWDLMNMIRTRTPAMEELTLLMTTDNMKELSERGRENPLTRSRLS
jgi:hypothetical protein